MAMVEDETLLHAMELWRACYGAMEVGRFGACGWLVLVRQEHVKAFCTRAVAPSSLIQNLDVQAQMPEVSVMLLCASSWPRVVVKCFFGWPHFIFVC
jgi:hypothetical protein